MVRTKAGRLLTGQEWQAVVAELSGREIEDNRKRLVISLSLAAGGLVAIMLIVWFTSGDSPVASVSEVVGRFGYVIEEVVGPGLDPRP